MSDYTGKCYCGTVQFKTMGEPLFTQYCHCQKCREIASLSQRTTDKTGYGFTAAYLTDHFSVTKGEDELENHPRGNSDLWLCKACKSLIYGISQDPTLQQGIGINVNNFAFTQGVPESFKADKHIWYENRMKDVDDTLPKYKDTPVEQMGSGILIS